MTWAARAVCVAAFALLPAAAWCQADPPTEALLLDIQRFVVEGDNPLSAAETDALLAPHLGRHHSLATIEAAAATLENAIHARGQTFHRVIVPAQKPASGELKLQVLKFRLDQVSVTGNQHFTRADILRTLPALVPGESPDIQLLGRQLALANEHPAKRVTVSIKESAKRDHLDAELKVRDVPAAQTFVGLTGHSRDFDNTINKNTGYTRLTVGHQQSNLFDLDHAATLAYTTSPDHLDKVSQYGAFYWLPLYGYHTSLNAYYTKSDVDTGTVGVGGQDFSVSGSGEFWGLRATYALPKSGEVTHNISLAYDRKYFDSNVAFAGTRLPTTAVGAQTVSLRYIARSEQSWGGIGGYVEFLRNSSGSRANDAFSYAVARIGAEPQWQAWRWGIDASYALGPDWNLSGAWRGQYTDDALIPGEQFGLGGVGSLRGLRERESTGDRGATLNLELTAPPVHVGTVPYVFFDIGQRKYVVRVPNIDTRDSASSLGVGMRWNWERLDLNVSCAHVLNGIADGTPRGHDRLDFALFYRF